MISRYLSPMKKQSIIQLVWRGALILATLCTVALYFAPKEEHRYVCRNTGAYLDTIEIYELKIFSDYIETDQSKWIHAMYKKPISHDWQYHDGSRAKGEIDPEVLPRFRLAGMLYDIRFVPYSTNLLARLFDGQPEPAAALVAEIRRLRARGTYLAPPTP